MMTTNSVETLIQFYMLQAYWMQLEIYFQSDFMIEVKLFCR